MRTSMKRLLSMLLILTMLLSSIVAFAEEVPTEVVIPVVSTEPMATLEPVATEEPTATEEPAVTEEPVATEEPAVTEEPVATEEPAVTEEPVATEEPAATEELAATEEPTATEEPSATEEPTATEEPAALVGVTAVVDNSTCLSDGEYDADDFKVSGDGAHSVNLKKLIVENGKAVAELEIGGNVDYIKANGGELQPSVYAFGGNFRMPVDLGDENAFYIVYTDENGVQIEAKYEMIIVIAALFEPATLELGADTFTVSDSSVSMKSGVITVRIDSASTEYTKLYLGAVTDDPGAASYIDGVANAESTGYRFTFELTTASLGKSINYVPVKADGTWYSGAQCKIEIPADLSETSEDVLTDGDYETSIESDFSMFKITAQSATVKDGVVTVTIETAKNTYDRFHFGTYDDRNEDGGYSDYVQGVKKTDEDGYTYSFTLPKSYMGKKMAFVPGKPDGSWYAGKNYTNQYYMTIPTALGNKIETGEGETGGDGSYTDGDYTASADTWVGFKLKEVRIKIHGETMTVTLVSGQVSYDAIYLGSATDADKSDRVYGTLIDGNTAFAYSFDLPVSALGTSVSYVPHYYMSDRWMEYTYSVKLPTKLSTAVPETNIDINSYADGDYNATTTTYNKTTIEGEAAYNSNAAFTVSATKVRISGDTLNVTLSDVSAERMHYPYLYLGTKEEAADASSVSMINCFTTPSSVAGGIVPNYSFTLPKSKLGQMVTFSCYSNTNETWYEYTLLIDKKLVADTPSTDPDAPSGGTTGTVENGSYNVNVESSASMFKIVSCVLTAKDGKYTAKIALSGTGYDKLFVGSAVDAANASEDRLIGYSINAAGKYEFTVPVSALDTPIAIAAHSANKGTWYDRNLTFKSEGMTKYTPGFNDGDYTTTVESDNSMFKIIACVVSVKDGKYTAKITLSGTGYDKLFVGSAAEADSSSEDQQISYSVNADGKYEFTLPVSALDTPISVAAHTVKSNRWTDRKLTFSAENMKPAGEGTPTEPDAGEGDAGDGETDQKPESDLSGSTGRVDSSTSLADGVYAPDKFSWSGGSGKVSISCKKVTVTNGKAVATLVFDSPNFSYVKANGQKIYGSHGSGTSTFQVPVELNANNRVLGMTTKMTADHEIAYTVYIYIAGAKDGANVSEDVEEAEIIGLNYVSADEIENSKLFKIYRYEDGFVGIRVEDVGMYLLVPEGAEVPVGLDEDAVLIQMPVQSAYIAADFPLEMTEQMQNEELLALITSIAWEESAYASIANGLTDGSIVYAGDYTAPEYAALLKTSCDLAVMTSAFAISEDEEALAAMREISERLTMLEIPAFVDRSTDEESEAARLEWLKVYGLIFNCEAEAGALYERLVSEVEEA